MFDKLGAQVRKNQGKIFLVMAGVIVMGLLISFSECGG